MKLLKPATLILSLLSFTACVSLSNDEVAISEPPIQQTGYYQKNISSDLPINYNDIQHPRLSKNGMVVSQHYLASEIGNNILKQGGNAIDAGIATAFSLAVVLPRAGNIGGGGFMLVHLAGTNEQFALDYREVAPELASKDMFLDSNGDVDAEKAWHSHQSAGVPGTVAGMYKAWRQWGSLPWSDLLQPAIGLAHDGFRVSDDMSSRLTYYTELLSENASSKQYLFKADGSVYQANEVLKQRDLAATLQRIAATEGKDFYEGKTADLIVADMQANDGLITHADLKAYQPIIRKTVRGEFTPSSSETYEIVSMPPPSSGGIHLIQILNTLEHFPLQRAGHNSAQSIHWMSEAMRQAYADRSKHLGDPSFYEVPVKYLTSEVYAKQIAMSIGNTARKSSDIAPVLIPKYESPDTTHFSIVDKEGNAVSNTFTINYTYGSGKMVTGAGFLLNNEMDDFAAKPGFANQYGLVGDEANKIEPDKRPLSSMSPTFVFKQNEQGKKELFMVLGGPGGSKIITSVLQNILNVTVHDMNVAEANHASRMHHQWLPDQVFVEDGISIDTLRLLQQKGHKVIYEEAMGSVQSIVIDEGVKQGAADPRRPDAIVVGH